MTYVMADVHGQYEKYKKMLEKINFSDSDTLYILGDVVDRGEHPAKILYDMSMRPNVFPIMGNHEHMARYMLEKLCTEITAENCETHLTEKDIEIMALWDINGGKTTVDDFYRFGAEDREYLLDYLSEFSPYEEVSVGGKDFVLVHGGLPDFSPEKPLYCYNEAAMLYHRTDYTKRYYPDKYLVTGHVPTCNIDEAYDGRIYIANGHIAIDCGAGHGKPLGCIRLDDMKEFYVE